MKVIYAGRGEGKTSYIIDQCKKLPGNKCILTTNIQTATYLSHEINKELTHTEIYSVLQLTPKLDQLHGKQYDWIFIDEITHFVYSVLSRAYIVGSPEIVATIGGEYLVNLEGLKPKKSCTTCDHMAVCQFYNSSIGDMSYKCAYYKEEEK